MGNETKIEWCDSTWSPVTGCRHKCEYCYAREIARRFGGYHPQYSAGLTMTDGNYTLGRNECKYIRRANGNVEKAPYPFGFEPTLHEYRLDDFKSKSGRNIFVCSMADLFGRWVPDEWIEKVFAACDAAPQHNYLFLTKNPKRYMELSQNGILPERGNFWYGTTITTYDKTSQFFSGKIGTNAFLSIEPLHSDFKENLLPLGGIKWVIIGAETGRSPNKIIPKKEWVDHITRTCDARNCPVFMKDSLLPIVGEENMRREFPAALGKGK